MPELSVRSLVLAGAAVVAPSLAASSFVSASPGALEDAPTALQAGGRSRGVDGGLTPQPLLNTPRFTGPIRWLSVAGHVASTTHDLGFESDTHALTRIEWYEKADRPCRFVVLQRSGPLGLEDTIVPFNLPGRSGVSVCNYNGQSALKVDLPAGQGASAIAICLNDKKNAAKERLKGIRLWSRSADLQTKQLGPENGPLETRRNNCVDWTPKVACAADELAASVRVHFGYDNSNGYAKGLQLGCRKVLLP
ncbi:MAG: hypothetical protein KIS78_00650 [Labilithrix sp.]|nr:hypothetical protein [Labilithrix sp.]